VTVAQRKTFVTESELLHDAYRLGVQIADSGFRPTFIVGLWRGGSSAGIAVQAYRGLSSYQQMVDNPETEIRIHGTQYLLDTLSYDDSLLIVDDVFSSGLTTSAVIRRLTSRLKNNMPADVRIAVPWYKPLYNRTTLTPDFYVNQTDDWLVMPYELSGLTFAEIAQNKPWMLPILNSMDNNSPQ